MHAEVDTRKNGSTDAEVGLVCDERDTKAFAEAQQVWEHDSYVTTATETSPVYPEMTIRVGVLPHPPRQCKGDNVSSIHTLQSRMKAPTPEKGATYAEVDTRKGVTYAEVVTRKNGLTYAEVGLTCAEVDTRKNELTYAEVDTRRNGMKGYMNEKDTGMTSLQATNQEGWSRDKVTVGDKSSPA